LKYRGVVSKKYNNSKSALILQKYTPEDIQKLLNSGKFKSEIARQLKIHIQAFNIYIKEHNLSYTPPPYRLSKTPSSQLKNKTGDKFKEPLEKFQEEFTESKRKRTLKELKDAYY
jgi:hypothetical protein